MEERRNFDAWTAKGRLSMDQQANARYKEILANFQAPDMDPGIKKDLDRYMEKIRSN
jgi:trimethylamine--corrinoid protein Co-methyltransferase